MSLCLKSINLLVMHIWHGEQLGKCMAALRRTRAQFKLAVRYCKQHEDAIRADLYANSLVDKTITNSGGK